MKIEIKINKPMIEGEVIIETQNELPIFDTTRFNRFVSYGIPRLKKYHDNDFKIYKEENYCEIINNKTSRIMAALYCYKTEQSCENYDKLVFLKNDLESVYRILKNKYPNKDFVNGYNLDREFLEISSPSPAFFGPLLFCFILLIPFIWVVFLWK